MAIEHDAIDNAELHEPKGASAASSGQVYIADGAGSGSWRYLPHSACYYDGLGGAGTTITAPTTYTLVGPTTTGDSDPRDFTHNSLGRLTYTGTPTLDANFHASISLKHSSASLVDVYFQFHKNGIAVAGAQHVTAALSSNFTHVSLASHFEIATNDYIEVFTKTASGNVVVHVMSIIGEAKV